MDVKASRAPAEVTVYEDGWIRRTSKGMIVGAFLAAANAIFYVAIIGLVLSAAESVREVLLGVGIGLLVFGWIIWLSIRASLRILKAGCASRATGSSSSGRCGPGAFL